MERDNHRSGSPLSVVREVPSLNTGGEEFTLWTQQWISKTAFNDGAGSANLRNDQPDGQVVLHGFYILGSLE